MPPTGSYYTSFAAFFFIRCGLLFFFSCHAAQTSCRSQRHALLERQEGGWGE